MQDNPQNASARRGQIDWALYDPNDENTPLLQELIIVALKDCGEAVFMRGYFGFSPDFFYEVRYGKRGRISKEKHKYSDYNEIAWAVLGAPLWWREGK